MEAFAPKENLLCGWGKAKKWRRCVAERSAIEKIRVFRGDWEYRLTGS